MRTLVCLSVLLTACSSGGDSVEHVADSAPQRPPVIDEIPVLADPNAPLRGNATVQPGIDSRIAFVGYKMVERGGEAGVVIDLYNRADFDITEATCEVTASASGTVLARSIAEWTGGVAAGEYAPAVAYFPNVGPGVADRVEWLCAVS